MERIYLTDLSLGFIYAIKENALNMDLKNAAIQFLSKYSGTDPKWYDEHEFNRITKMVFLDYLDTADHPAYDIRNFFEQKRMWGYDDFEAMLSTLLVSKVRDENGYVNGFREEERV